MISNKLSSNKLYWNARPTNEGSTEFHVGHVNYMNLAGSWDPIDTSIVYKDGVFVVEKAPFTFTAPLLSDEATCFTNDNRYDIFTKAMLDTPSLSMHTIAQGVTSVKGEIYQMPNDDSRSAVLYPNAYPKYNADLIYHIRHGRAPRFEKLVRFNKPLAGDIKLEFIVEYSNSVEVQVGNYLIDERTLNQSNGFNIKGNGRGLGIKTLKLWDSNPTGRKIEEIQATMQKIGENKYLLTKYISADFFKDAVFPVYTDSTSTFYPDPSVETSSVDGLVRENYSTGSGISWASIRGGAGVSALDLQTESWPVEVFGDTTTNNWREFRRGAFLFDTSALPDTDSIDSAILSLYGSNKYDNLSATPTINIYSSAPASDTELVGGDYDSLGSTNYATAITYASWNTAGYNDFTLNASGLAAISATGVSKFGLRSESFDVNDAEPTWSANGLGFKIRMADYAGTVNDPKLVVTHSAVASTFKPRVMILL